jgi:hypothetical protein
MRTVFADAGFRVRWERLDAQISRAILSLEPSDELHEKTTARSRMAAHASLSAFFRPHGVAVVGAGRRRGRIGAEIFHNLIACGYRGRVVPVNPSGQPVEGVPSVPARDGNRRRCLVGSGRRAVRAGRIGGSTTASPKE